MARQFLKNISFLFFLLAVPYTVSAQWHELSFSHPENQPMIFDSIAPGETASKTVELYNGCDSALTVTEFFVMGENTANFTTNYHPPFIIGAHSFVPITITFTGKELGHYSAGLYAVSTRYNDILRLEGTIEYPHATFVANNYIDFGEIEASSSSTKTVKIQNTGKMPGKLLSAAIEGDDSTKFTVAAFSPVTLDPGGFKTISVTFKPGAEVPAQAILHVKTDAGDVFVSLIGEGAYLKPRLSVDDYNYNYIDSTIYFFTDNQPINKRFKIKNTGRADIYFSAFEIRGEDAEVFSLESPYSNQYDGLSGNTSLEVHIRFTPRDNNFARAVLYVEGPGAKLQVKLLGQAISMVGSSVENNSFFINAASVNPNPASNEAVARFSFKKQVFAAIQVVDVYGRIIRTLQEMSLLDSGEHVVRWDRSNDDGILCANGLYRIIITGENGFYSLPVIISN